MNARPLFSRSAWADVRDLIRDRKGRLLMALDLDGTLAPIVRRPASARVPKATLAALGRAARLPGVRIALISARPLRDLRRLAPVRGVARVAQYGLEGAVAPPAGVRRGLRRRARSLLKLLRPVPASFPGAWLEPKGLSVAVHHRALTARRRAALLRSLRALERRARALGFGVELGDRVHDFVPRGHDKGRALSALRARARPSAMIYFGDSAGDEPAFQAMARTDVPVRVGRGPTRARYRVRGPQDVARFLRALVAERTRIPRA